MSFEAHQFGSALKIARRAFGTVDNIWTGFGGNPSSRAVNAQVAATLAQAEETSRLADEQRTANLIAAAAFDIERHGHTAPELLETIRERLGLEVLLT